MLSVFAWLSVDIQKFRQRKRDIVESLKPGNEKRIRETENIDLYMGTASFTGMKTVWWTMNDGNIRRHAMPVEIDAEKREEFVTDYPIMTSVGKWTNSMMNVQYHEVYKFTLFVGTFFRQKEPSQDFHQFSNS